MSCNALHKTTAISSAISAGQSPTRFSDVSESDNAPSTLREWMPLAGSKRGPDLAIHVQRDEPCAPQPAKDTIVLQRDRSSSTGECPGTPVTEDEQQHGHFDLSVSNHPANRGETTTVASVDWESTRSMKRNRTQRDLLTDDAKRANHIASEKRRRSIIRIGFKEMSDIIPALRNTTNSKSTILFKAVQYIKYLDKRNRSLNEKIESLKIQIKMKHEAGNHLQGYALASRAPSWLKQRKSTTYHDDTMPKENDDTATDNHLPQEAVAALLIHQNHQKQLARLQEELQMQQALLVKRNVNSRPSISIPSLTPISSPRVSQHSQDDALKQSSPTALQGWSNLQETEANSYSSISIPVSEIPEPVLPIHPMDTSLSTPPCTSPSHLHASSVHNNVISPTTSTTSSLPSYTPALLIPMQDDDSYWKPNTPSDAPCFNIPADEEFHQEPLKRERLLSCGKLKSI